jgi:acetyl esterase/lipase
LGRKRKSIVHVSCFSSKIDEMSEIGQESTFEKAKRQDQESRKSFDGVKTIGVKVSLSQDKSLKSLYYPGKGGLILDIHGGGFCFKSVLDNDVYCSYLNKLTGYTVLNLDFTSSYIAPYPRQRDDILVETSSFYSSHPEMMGLPLTIVGHSSGGNLAASLTIDFPYPISALLLNYPFLDLAKDPANRPVIENAFPDFLLNDWINMYAPDKTKRTNPLVSPLYIGKDEAKFFPPTCITIAKNCRLQEDGRAFFDLLQNAKVPSKLFEIDDRHGFIERNMRNLFTSPDDEEVKKAKFVSDECFTWLSNNLRK